MYEAEKTEVFAKWLDNLKDHHVKARVKTRIERAKKGNFGDWSPEGGEVRAMRIDYGPGYRLYYTIRHNRIIFLLCGGTKRAQQTDIQKAHKLIEEIE